MLVVIMEGFFGNVLKRQLKLNLKNPLNISGIPDLYQLGW